MNENNDNVFLENNELLDLKSFQREQSQFQTTNIENERHALLQKLKDMRTELANIEAEFEKGKRKNKGLDPYEKWQLERRLEDINAMLHFAGIQVSQREKSGEQINPEERYIEVLKEEVKRSSGEVNRDKWTVSQYINPKSQAMEKYMASCKDDVAELDSHIRK